MGYWDYDPFSTKARHIESRNGDDQALVYSTLLNDANGYPTNSSYKNTNFDDLHTIPQLGGPKHQYNGAESFEESNTCKCEKCRNHHNGDYNEINIKINFNTLLLLFLVCIIVMSMISDYIVMSRMRQYSQSQFQVQPQIYYAQAAPQVPTKQAVNL